MKKLLTAAIAIVMGATLAGTLASCKKKDPVNNDAEIAERAITSIREYYQDKAKETPADYQVMGQTRVDKTSYDVSWTVLPAATCTIENFSTYVSVGTTMNETTKEYTVSITKATEVIDYTLTASVTVGTATKTASFDRTVPKKLSGGTEEVKSVSLSFDAAKANRTDYSSSLQVWKENGITLTNSGNVGDYANPVRLYKNTSVKIEYPGISVLVFHSGTKAGTSDYPAYLLQSLQAANWDGAEITASEDGLDVTVKLEIPVDELEFTASAGQIRLLSLDIEAIVGGATDAQKVAGAVKSLDLATKSYTAVGEYDLPSEKNGTTVTWAVKETSEYASIKGDKLSTLSIDKMPAENTDVVLTATIQSGEEKATKEFTITIIPLGLTNNGTEEHPYTTTEAIRVTKTLGEGVTAENEVYVKGFVIDPGTYSTYKSYDIYIVEEYAENKDKTSEDAFYIFSVKVQGNEEYLSETKGLLKGDEVTFKGQLQYYKSGDTLTPELKNATIVKVVEVKDDRAPEDKTTAAVAELTLGKTTYDTLGSVTLPTTSVRGVTVTWASGNTEYITISEDGKTMNIVKLPDSGTQTVTVTATVKCGEGADEVTKTKPITITLNTASTKGTESDPFTVAEVQALDIENNGYYGSTTFYVKGYVVASGTYASNYNNFTGVYIADSALTASTAKEALQVYGLAVDGTYIVDNEHPLQIGDLITVVGYIQNRNDVIQVTFKDATNPITVAKEEASDSDKIALALAAVSSTLDMVDEAGEITLPVSTVSGVTLAWSTTDTTYTVIDGTKLNVASLPAEAATVTLTVTASCGEATSEPKTVTIAIAAALPEDVVTETLNFATNFSTYASDWGTGYSSHEVSFSEIGASKLSGTVVLSSANKQNSGSTIDDKPVLASKNDTVQYATLTVQDVSVKSVEFVLEQWTTKTFTNIHIEYYNGTEWVKCSNDFTIPGTIASNVSIDDGVTQIRLVYNGISGTSNVQLGLGSVKLTVLPLTDDGKIAAAIEAAKGAISLRDKYTAGSIVTLPSTQDDANLTWEIKEGTGVTLDGYTMTCNEITSGDEAEVTLTVTVKIGDATGSKDIKVTIVKLAQFVAGTYKMFVVQGNLDGTPKLYFTGTINTSNFGTTSRDISGAADVVVENASGGYYIKVNDKYLELNASHRMTYVDNPTDIWWYDGANEVFTWYVASEKETYYLGTYGTYETISASKISYLSSEENYSVVLTVEKDTRDEVAKIAQALEAVEDTLTVTAALDKTLPVSTVSDVTFSWESESETYTVEDGKLIVSALPEEEVTFNLTLTASCGESSSATKTVVVTVKAKEKNLTLTYDSFEKKSNKYEDYAGNHGVSGYVVALSEVMINTYGDNSAYKVIQMRASTGYLTVDGEFSKVVVSVASTYNDSSEVNNVSVYAGETKLTAIHKSTEPTDKTVTSSGTARTLYIHTFEWIVESEGTQTFKVAKENTGAYYALSIQFVGPLTDAEKIEAAKEYVKLKDIYEAGDVNLPATSNGATLTWSVEDGKGIVTIADDGIKMTVTNPEEETQITLTVTIACGSADSATKDIDITVVPKVATNYGTLEAPISVEEALAIAAKECPLSGDWTKEIVYVTGKVTQAPEGKNLTIADLNDANKTILVYGSIQKDGVAAPAQNDILKVSGYITKFKYNDPGQTSGTIEFSKKDDTEVYVENNERGNSTITLGNHEGATVTGDLSEEVTTLTKANGATVTITVTAASGKIINAVYAGSTKLEGTDGSYTFTVAGNVNVTVETQDEDAPQTQEYELSFDTTDARTTLNTSKQVWEANGITLTNEKASSSSNVADYSKPARFYSGSSIKVECANMTKIVFVCNTTGYATTLSTSIGTQEGVTVSVEGKNVTVTFATASSELNITKLTAKCFIDSLTVTVQA